MRIGSLFSGIGGLELGLEMAGLFPAVWQVEQDPYCQRILARHWPDAERHNDVRQVGAHNLAPVDLICGGFPCQDISSAGKGAGLSGERSGLWYEYLRIVRELRPAWVVVENVASGATRWVDAVRADLDGAGYETLPVPLSASDVGAPHLRRRVFIVAHSKREQLRQQQGRGSGQGGQGAAFTPDHGKAGAPAHSNHARLAQREGIGSDPCQELPSTQRSDGDACNPDPKGQSVEHEHEQVEGLREPASHSGWDRWPAFPAVCGVDDGVPHRVDRLRALGNAVVPQCAEVIGWMIRELAGA